MRQLVKIPLLSAALFLAAGSAFAGAPVITKYDAHLLEKEVRLNISWQSDEPVTKIIASADKEQIVVTQGIDNDRNDAGYAGTVDVVVPFNPENLVSGRSYYMNQQTTTPTQQQSTEIAQNSVTPYQYAVGYSIQLVDEVNQRSTLVKDRIRRFDEPRIERGSSPSQAQEKKTVTENSATVDLSNLPNTAANAALNVLQQVTAKPRITDLNVKNYADSRAGFEVSAQDDKGVERISLEVRNMQGQIVQEETLECSTQKQCAKSSSTFSLNPGKYTVSAVAQDGDNNRSDKKVKDFSVQGIQSSTGQETPQASSQSAQTAEGTQAAAGTGL